MRWAIDLLAMALALLGAVFVLLSAVGLLRMPDPYMRAQTASKGSTLGAAAALLAAAVYFTDSAMAVRAVLVIAFLFLTTPIAAHMICRAAYLADVPLSEETYIDELRGRYDPSTHRLDSTPTDPNQPTDTTPP
jgi:multicomponent Na+:H+ antiporter subunit G